MVADARSGNGNGGFGVRIPDPIVGITAGATAAVGPGTERRRGATVVTGSRGTRGSDAIEADGGVCGSCPGGGVVIGGGVRGDWGGDGNGDSVGVRGGVSGSAKKLEGSNGGSSGTTDGVFSSIHSTSDGVYSDGDVG